jgi:hypothetical protein
MYVQLVRQVDHDGLGLGKHPQSINGILTTRAALLGPAKGRSQEAQADAVDANHSAVNLGRHAHGLVDVLREDAGHQPKVGVVGLRDDLLLRLEFVEHRHRAKDLVAQDLGVGVDVSENCRLNEEALI